MNKPLIVFKLIFYRSMGWGAISNFITKFSEKIPMDFLDVKIASSIALEGTDLDDNFSLVKKILTYNSQFKMIKRPENIYETGTKYEYAMFILVEYDQLFDVVDLQNLYLICDVCKKYRIVSLVSGKDDDYFKTSHYFSFLTRNKGEIYNNVFFKSTMIKHLQTSNIGILSKFLPLLPVNEGQDIQIRKKVSEFANIECVKELLSGKQASESTSLIMAGAFRKLSHNYQKLKNCDIEKCAVCLSDLSVLSFLLFCFSLDEKENSFRDFLDFSAELQGVILWSNGCIQLIENIVFHSNNKCGVFSFRILDGNTTYIREKYLLKDEPKKWVEIMIADYAGCRKTLNIAQNFLKNLSKTEQKKAFENLNPSHFFATNEKISQAWKQYYSEKENIINHYGLKIFQEVVKRSEGHFIIQSFSTHQPQAGEYYYDEDEKKIEIPQISMPGTVYSILFPIVRKNVKREFYDYGIEGLTNQINSHDSLFDYAIEKKTIPIIKEVISSQKKQELIRQIVDELMKKKDNEGDKDINGKEDKLIISICASEFRGDIAEIIYKAIILTMLKKDIKCHIVMYECQPEFVRMFLDVAYLGSINLKGELNYKDCGQIVLYTAEYYEEIVILPNNWNGSLIINNFNHFARETRWDEYFEKWNFDSSEDNLGKILKWHYPFDVLVEDDCKDTVFEKYVQTIIKRNIQEQELGCKIENVHMRLGSTIHVNHFYEAEILFGNSFFVERFALLMIKSMLRDAEPINRNDKLTLYGYANYSEQTVFCTMQFLTKILPGIDVDYAILERESEDRGYTHVDRIRYSSYEKSEEKEVKMGEKYFESRKIVCIIPIASTLKTNEKMINLFLEQNGVKCKSSFWRNFELVLVGSNEKNKYWEKDGKRIIGKKGMEIFPIPEFFVEVTLDYMEPLECKMCFPDNAIDEMPLIEVNAASTIPNQAFGLYGKKCDNYVITKQILEQAEKEQEILKDLLIYRHLERNENHFLFYFQTEQLIAKYPEKICEWLKGIKNKIEINVNDYIVLFCPAHFSNAGFIEYVNSYVFESAAIVIRDDVDKEYRGNFSTKYSNLKCFIEKLMQYRSKGNLERKIRLFYVDDAIITGHTFHRARSLVQSILGGHHLMDARQQYVVFDGIFVLIDRNSKFSKWQYTGINEENRLYAFRTVNISSIRNHGDACVYCNLAKEAKTLKMSSVTKNMGQYWSSEEEKFSVISLSKYLKNQEKNKGLKDLEKEDKKERFFRRLVCTNNSMVFLNEKYHGNCKEEALKQLLILILEGSTMHKGEEAEYFLSYCKVLSRPFRVFDKTVREAVFDFLLLTCICFLESKNYDSVIDASEKKPYLREEKIKEKFLEVEKFINKFFVSKSQRQDLLKVLLKQLTDMKSNYIMLRDTMEQILSYSGTLDTKSGESLIQYYKYLIKKLTGVSSDTSKSLWLDRMLCAKLKDSKNDIQRDIYLENVWIYQDAFQKLYERANKESIGWENLLNSLHELRFTNELIKFVKKEIIEYLKPYQFKDFISVLKQYNLCNNKDELTNNGLIFVGANLLLRHVLTTNFENGLRQEKTLYKGNLTKIDYIATCMKYIMEAKEVIIIIEFDAEYDLWENIIVNRFNDLLTENMKTEKIIWEQKKEYIILGSSEEKKDRWTIREKGVEAKVHEFQKKTSWKEKGYDYNDTEGFFWWELGYDTGYPVYIYATWEKSERNSASEIEQLNRIRSVMQYYWELNNFAFNKSNERFFYEIAQQRKKNAIHSRQKAHTHTKSDIKLQQYDHMLLDDKYSECYKSDLLMLLADLNVSEHYRNSLTAEYYLKGDKLRLSESNTELSPFAKQGEFYVISSEAALKTKMIISYEQPLFKDDIRYTTTDRVVAYDNTNSEREAYLLIYSLMINAVSNNRGKVDNGCVTVYLSKTNDGRLRIANKIGENAEEKTIDQIMDELRYPPEEEQQGISLWSMSRYIKGVIANILDEELKKLEQSKNNINEENLKRMKQRILQLFGKTFQISVEIIERKEAKYFSVSVPILAEKYEEKS